MTIFLKPIRLFSRRKYPFCDIFYEAKEYKFWTRQWYPKKNRHGLVYLVVKCTFRRWRRRRRRELLDNMKIEKKYTIDKGFFISYFLFANAKNRIIGDGRIERPTCEDQFEAKHPKMARRFARVGWFFFLLAAFI